jgi:hypothetical protein
MLSKDYSSGRILWKHLMRLRCLFLVLFFLSWAPRFAQADDYAQATWPNLLHTMIRFNALDISDTTLLDEYGIVTECDLYKVFYADDFKWQKVRQAMQQSIKMHVASFPTGYRYDQKMQLDRYDFATKLFRFAKKSTINNVNSFTLYAVNGTSCGSTDITIIPRTFKAMLQTPLTLEGIPMGEGDAKALLARMDQAQNDIRLIYARFNLRIVYIEPFQKVLVSPRDTTSYTYKQQNEAMPEYVRFDTRLDSIDFFEDPEMTKLIYQY